MVWEFRYRSPRVMETVRIETITNDEVEAKALAEALLAKLSSPGLRFVYLKPDVAARSLDFPELVAKYGALVTRAVPVVDEEDRLPERVPPMSGELMPQTPAELAGEPLPPDGVDDEMSGPRVKRPHGASKPAARVGQ